MPITVNFPVRPVVDRWLARLLPPRCLVCDGAGVAGRDLCADCLAGLPWLGAACPSCAIPLPEDAGLVDERGPASCPAGGNVMHTRQGLPGPSAGVPITCLAAPQPALVCGACQCCPPPLSEVRAAFLYRAPLDRLLPRLKFHGGLGSARLLGGLMVEVASGWPRPDALLPIPLHPARLRERGYDQALELARPLARALQLPLQPGLLRRIRATPPQSRLNAARRRRNLQGAFVAVGGALPRHVTLVDDVMTTGATLHAAATALRRAGVPRVDAWLCARVP